jgi:hypothetical protein
MLYDLPRFARDRQCPWGPIAFRCADPKWTLGTDSLEQRLSDLMSEPNLILDYASPRKRSRFRLASKSLLDCRWVEEDLAVREWLAGQSQAKLAIAVTGVMLALSGGIVASEWHRTAVGMLLIILVLIGLALALVPAVIQQSWRETVLRIGDGTMRLVMGGPLARRRWSWRLEQVLAVRVIATQVREDDGAPVLGEVEILAEGSPPIRLFTDHREGMLNGMVVEIERAVRGERA